MSKNNQKRANQLYLSEIGQILDNLQKAYDPEQLKMSDTPMRTGLHVADHWSVEVMKFITVSKKLLENFNERLDEMEDRELVEKVADELKKQVEAKMCFFCGTTRDKLERERETGICFRTKDTIVWACDICLNKHHVLTELEEKAKENNPLNDPILKKYANQ